MTYTEACLAINMIPKVGPVRLRRLLGVFGEPQAILRAPVDRLAAVDGIGPELARRIVTWEEKVDLPAELARMAAAGHPGPDRRLRPVPRAVADDPRSAHRALRLG